VADSAHGKLRATGYHADERMMQRQSGAQFWCAVTGHSLTPNDPYARSVWCFQDLSHQWNVSELRPRDREVAILACEGHTAKEIGRLLDLSPRTVEAYLARIKHKLAVRNVAELASRIRPGSPSGD
jgi:DNA-binding CsgD family transcriptional regulator